MGKASIYSAKKHKFRYLIHFSAGFLDALRRCSSFIRKALCYSVVKFPSGEARRQA